MVGLLDWNGRIVRGQVAEGLHDTHAGDHWRMHV
jgi:hypothetical protein